MPHRGARQASPPIRRNGPDCIGLFPSDASDLPAAPVPSFPPEAGEHAIRCRTGGRRLAGEFGPELRRGDCLTGDGGRVARIVQRREVRGEGAIFQRPAGEERIEAGEGAGVGAAGVRGERGRGEGAGRLGKRGEGGGRGGNERGHGVFLIGS